MEERLALEKVSPERLHFHKKMILHLIWRSKIKKNPYVIVSGACGAMMYGASGGSCSAPSECASSCARTYSARSRVRRRTVTRPLLRLR